MKPVKKGAVKATTKKRPVKKTKKLSIKNMDDVQRLVHLLQVHQVELEHQNEELRIAQVELEVSRNKYVNFFDFSPIPYFTLDKEGIIKEVNLRASIIFGIDRKKLIGRNLIRFIPSDYRGIFQSFIKNVFNSKVKQSCQLKITGKDNSELQMLIEGINIDDPLETDQQCQVALIDLTEYKNVEEKLNKTNEELIELNASKDKFFSIIGHDLRGPFQALLSYSNLLATDINDLSQEEIVQFSQGLNEITINVYNLIENLLNWSMMQRDMIEHNAENLDLNDVVNKIIQLLNQVAKDKNISISNDAEPGAVVIADPNMLRSVLQNLIMNAVKYTPKGGKVMVSSKSKGNKLEVTVSDSGIGIEKLRASKIFDFGSLNTTKGTYDEIGTGLGLPLCREFVERNEGTIRVESEPGKGSKFIFTLRKAIS
jgi:PAS domain S-box-containing protein